MIAWAAGLRAVAAITPILAALPPMLALSLIALSAIDRLPLPPWPRADLARPQRSSRT